MNYGGPKVHNTMTLVRQKADNIITLTHLVGYCCCIVD